MAENTTSASPLEEAIKQQNGTSQYDFSENKSSQEIETQDRRFFSQGERKSMPAADKAGPHNSFPIKSQQDVYNAARLAGHAKNPDAVRSRIRSIAKRKGFSLPKSWQKKSASRSVDEPEVFDDFIEIDFPEGFDVPAYEVDADDTVDSQGFTSETEEERAVTPVQNPPDATPEPGTHHDAYAGMHSHRHEHVADGYSHEHHHQHVNDNDHFHGHAHGHARAHTPEERELYKHTEQPLSNHDEEKKLSETEKRSNEPINSIQQTASMYMPFIRVDAAKREVLGQATSEVPDSYGTIFAYYPKAWEQWRGNIREQHDPKKAVGKRIQHFLNPESRSVDLHVRVSRGAQDTWMKIEDDVLTGFSLSVIPDTEFGNDYRKWPKKTFEGREYPYLPRYSIAEVSLVDNPSCPNCNIQIVRSDGFATDVLDVTDEEEKPIERAVVRGMDAETVSKMHKGIKATLHSAMTQMENCNCPTCQKVARMLDPDMDGDIDLGGLDDPDHDAKQLGVETERAITGIVERSLQPVYSRLQKIAGSLAKSTPENYDSIVTSVIARAFETFDQKLEAIAKQSSFEEVRAELSAVKSQVDKIADQPMPGGPVMNASNIPMPATASLAQPVEKRLPTDAPISYGQQGYGSVYDAVATLSRAGKLNTTDKQVDAVAAALAEQRRR